MHSKSKLIFWSPILLFNSSKRNDVAVQTNAALDHNETEREIPYHIKKYFDENYSPNWYFVVGKDFASYATYSSKHYIFLYIGQLTMLLCKLKSADNKTLLFGLILEYISDSHILWKIIYIKLSVRLNLVVF